MTCVVFMTGEDPEVERLREEVETLAPMEVIRGKDREVGRGTRPTYLRVRELVAADAGIGQVWFWDADLSELWRLLVRWPLKRRVPVRVFEVRGPWPAGGGLRSRVKRWLLRRTWRRHHVMLAARTEELADAWRKSGWLPPESCVAAPTLQLAERRGVPGAKRSIAARDELRFVIAGQLSRRKSIAEIVSLFLAGKVDGTLEIAGELQHGATLEDLALDSLPAEPHARVILERKFLSEAELHGRVAGAHYALMVYRNWDDRMEVSMVYAAASAGTPVIGSNRGWVARMIATYELGYTVDPDDREGIAERLRACALPGSAEYERFVSGCRRMVAEHRAEAVVPRLLEVLGVGA
jgi:glycosyltransferase involved in cell wall biosynthesis